MGLAVPQHELGGVVSAVADRPPGIERRPLPIEELVRLSDSVDGGAGRETSASGRVPKTLRQIRKKQRASFVANVAGEQVIHGLRGSESGSRALTREAAAKQIRRGGARRQREEVLPVRDGGHRCNRSIRVRQFGKL